MKVQDLHNPAIAETEKDLPHEGNDMPTDQSVKAENNDGMLNTGGDTPPLDKADSHGDEQADADTADKDTEADAENEVDAEADPEVDIEAGADADVKDETEAEDDTEDDPDSGTALSWDLALTCDSTGLNAITQIIVEDDGDLLGDPDLIDRLEAFLKGDTKFDTDKKKLQAGQKLLREFYAKHNRAWSGVVGTFTDYAVQIGRLLIVLKALMKACGEKWEPWAAENLKFMAPRTRQANMQLAKVPGIDKHLHFGKERLLLLAAATKGAGGDDPIGEFLKRYNLGFDPAEEIDLDAYKDAVDLALDFERLKKAGLSVDIEALKMFKADGKKVGASLIDTLKIIEKTDGDPNKYLRDPDDDDDSIEGEKKAQSFQKIAITLAGTIDWLSSHEEFAKDVDVAKIDELAAKLAELRRLIAASDTSEADD
jgi:hypothetical protein